MRVTTIALVLVSLIAGGVCYGADACCAGSGTVAAPLPDNTLSAEEQAAGWKLLFDGKTKDGWGCTDANSTGWKVQGGALYYDLTGGGMLYSKERYGNFELKIDLMVDKGTNSGIFIRWDKLDDPVQTGIEMQVFDSAAETTPGKHSCGAIYDVLAPSENAMKPAMQWNTAVIRCKDNFISIAMNGKRIVQMDLNRWTQPHMNPDGSRNKFDTAYKEMPRSGHVGLQDHGAKVWYKNIKVRELK